MPQRSFKAEWDATQTALIRGYGPMVGQDTYKLDEPLSTHIYNQVQAGSTQFSQQAEGAGSDPPANEGMNPGF